jgi:hypothetical protein
MIGDGKIVDFIFLLITAIPAFYYLNKATQGERMKLRSLPQLEAISEGVDRAVETGLPIIASAGNIAYLSGMYAPMTIAGMNIFRHTATLAVRKGARIIGLVPQLPEVISLMDGIFKEVCVKEGKPEMYRREDIIYSGNNEAAYSLGSLGVLGSEGCALWVAVGANQSSVSGPTGLARMAGAITITGTARWGMNGTFAMFSDYFLSMDDVYSAGALVSGDPMVESTLIGGDVAKWVSVGMLILGSLLALANLPVIQWLNI